MNKPLLSSVTLVLLGSQAVFAADSDYIAIGEFEPMVVTATRTAETADETLASVTVITRRDIERQQARSIQDVLRGVPGISIANNGGPGKNTSLFLRGTESDHVLVLIDGVKTGSATSGTTPFQYIPIDQVERIEIVRGPRSSLYGSEAIGGVIQIFTRKGGGVFKPSFSVGGGSYNTYNASAGISGGGDRGWFNVNVSTVDTAGFNACNGKPLPDGAGCFTTEPDKDGYNNLSGSLRGGYRFENGIEVDAYALRSENDTDYDGSFVNESDAVEQILGVTFRYSLLDSWRLALTGGRSQDDSKNYKDGLFKSRFNTERDTVSLQNDITVAKDHLLTLGADYQDDRIDSTTPYAVTSRNNKGLFFQYLGMIGAHEIQASLREDDNEQFDKRTTGGLAWGYPLSGKLRLTASYGTAFKAPTFNELYWPGYGNPDLRPEESRSLEVGLKGTSRGSNWSFNIYETHVDDLIAYDAATFAPGNVDEVYIRGLEAAVTAQVAGWTLATNLTLLKPENRSAGSNKGNILPRRAEQSLRFDADRSFGRYSLGATFLAEGRRYDELANTRRLDSYATVDLRAGYRVSERWLLQGRIENLFDEQYETAAFYNQPDRSLFVTVRYQP
ncbi:MAG TPA: TonB-dependent vitamin B12 receptor [Gammaproteobacteria bacterium]|nr:TonB-dependent vitamin B12 receptor [Gammaproteobacteria bacterium]